MSSNSRIGWADSTWNPITGCSRVSDGCRHCYAERLAGTRLAKHAHYEGLTRISGGEPKWNGEVRFNEDVLLQPLRWRKPRRIFVNSMGDLFHENVPDEWLDTVYEVMLSAPHHVYQILTKRPQRMAQYIDHSSFIDKFMRGEMDYVWHGTSCENQEAADERIPHLLRVPGNRFVSLEPLLGGIDLHRWLWRYQAVPYYDGVGVIPEDTADEVDWVIVGGESGKGYRECQVEWIEHIVNQCKAAGVPAFVKQDSHFRSGQQGRIPDDLWAVKEFPKAMLQHLEAARGGMTEHE